MPYYHRSLFIFHLETKVSLSKNDVQQCRNVIEGDVPIAVNVSIFRIKVGAKNNIHQSRYICYGDITVLVDIAHVEHRPMASAVRELHVVDVELGHQRA